MLIYNAMDYYEWTATVGKKDHNSNYPHPQEYSDKQGNTVGKLSDNNARFREKSSHPDRLFKQNVVEKIGRVSEQFYQLVFLKQSIVSMIREQKMRMGDFMRDLKKYLFQLEMKSQRESTKNSRENPMKASRTMPSQNSGNLFLQQNQQNNDIKLHCERLTLENEELKKKYETMLLKYRDEIEKLAVNVTPSAMKGQFNEHFDQQLLAQNAYLKQQLREGEQKLKNQQYKYFDKVKRLEAQIIELEDQYMKETKQFQRALAKYKERERQYSYQESEIERKNLILFEREKRISQREILIKQELTTIERRQTKISDYEHNQLRRERKKIEEGKDHLRNEYYANYDRLPQQKARTNYRHHEGTLSERQSSSGNRFNSKVNINARLREIQQEKKRINGIQASRYSQAGMKSQRSSSRKHLHQFGGNQALLQGKYSAKKQIGGQNVNIKLNSMLQLLQHDLNQIK